MRWRRVGRWFGALAWAWVLVVAFASCGGSSTDLSGPADGSVSTDGPMFGVPDGGGICPTLSCANLGYGCGWNGDGCNTALQCGACASPDYCGGGGFSQCGDAPAPLDAATRCTPKTCADLGYTCGVNGDGCGGMIDCGAGCVAPAYCGGGGFSQCGGNDTALPDGAPRCTPTTCAALGLGCGFAGDGCGGLLDCRAAGGCPAPTYCGGGGFDECGGNAGPAACTPRTCADQGFDCGPAGDGCGHALDCGSSCPAGQACGAAGQPGICGVGPTCTGLCTQRPACTAATTTTISGVVRAATSAWVPKNTVPDPVPGVLVYIPNAPVQPFAPGVQCGTCSADVSGDPLVSNTTNFDGTFTLTNVPVSKNGGDPIPVVIQLGRWRRQFAFTISKPCADNPVGTLEMPSVESATSDIPLTAISTGAVDSLECILLKMGVDQSQFTTNVAAQPGRIHVYSAGPGTADKDGHGPGAYIAAGKNQAQPDETTLMGSAATGPTSGTYMNYDQIMLPCWGAEYFKSTSELAHLVSYAQAGGHFFATHFSYTWLFQNDLFAGTALWDVNSDTNPNYTPFTGNVSRAVPPPVSTPPGLFVEWLNYVGALDAATPAAAPPNPATVTIQAARHDVDGVLGASTPWIDGTDPNQSGAAARTLLHFTFDVNSCGHAIFSDFHVVNQTNTNGVAFPQECDKSALTAQGRVLEYMIWNLASCAGGTPPTGCTPRTCADQRLTCGPAGDGCGGALACGDCAAPATCGGGGVPGQCGGGGACVPSTCAQQQIGCGPAGDGCGNVLTCGTCAPPQTCGGGGVAGQCGGGSACRPATCADQNVSCGVYGDGCGGTVDCGICGAPMTCGGGGVPGQCGGTGACTPRTCADQNIGCGPTGDGCGNLIQCGPCTPPETCGGGGVRGQCGGGQNAR